MLATRFGVIAVAVKEWTTVSKITPISHLQPREVFPRLQDFALTKCKNAFEMWKRPTAIPAQDDPAIHAGVTKNYAGMSTTGILRRTVLLCEEGQTGRWGAGFDGPSKT